MEFMLETITDIKNNKKRAKEDTPQHTRMKKWLQKVLQIDVLTEYIYVFCCCIVIDSQAQLNVVRDAYHRA